MQGRLRYVSLLVALSVFSAELAIARDGTRVRGLDKYSVQLLAQALARSPTVRGLVARVENSDLILYLRFGQVRLGTTASTKLMSAAGSTRFVMVTLDPMATRATLIACLGHELEHAVELANSPEVRDEEGMRAMLARIGWRSGRDSWETKAAVEAGRRVARELDDPSAADARADDGQSRAGTFWARSKARTAPGSRAPLPPLSDPPGGGLE